MSSLRQARRRLATFLLLVLTGLVLPAWAAPTVSLTSPAEGASYLAPASLTLSATATPSPGTTLSRLDLLVDDLVVATGAASPFVFTWNNVPPGRYRLTARATDSGGGVTTSTARTITVLSVASALLPILFELLDDSPPSVSLTAPAAGATFTAPATITLTATAADTDGTISKVEFFQGTTLIGTATASPYTVTWNSVPAGSYSLTAKATDNLGAVTTSAARTITVTANQAPTVSLTAPANGTSYVAPAAITLTATAADTDGTISKVEFFQGTTLIGTATAAPYTVAWNSVPAGSYSLTAKATDNLGAATTSAARTITVSGSGPTILYLHGDHLGTPQVATNEANVVVWRNLPTGEPFGMALPEEDPDGDGRATVINLRFPGQYFDRETQLHYNYFRDYDPSTGRYVQSDPIGLRGGGLSLYLYAKNNPLSFTDPRGESVAAVVVGGGVLIVGGAIMSALPKPKPSDSTFPEAANDSKFGDRTCPPDCNEWRKALNRMYLALMESDRVAKVPGANLVRWTWFWVQVKLYEKDCGPYAPPPDTLGDIYLR